MDKIRIVLVVLIVFWSAILSTLMLHTNLVISKRRSDRERGDDISASVISFENDVRPQCVKQMLIFGNVTDMKHWPELHEWYELMEESVTLGHDAALGCETEDGNCTIQLSLGTDVKLFGGKDAVIFGVLPQAFKGRIEALKTLKPELNQTWFFYSTESPHRTILWNQNLNMSQLKYHKLISYRWDSHIYLTFGSYEYQPPSNASVSLTPQWKQNVTKDHLIAWVSSNCNEISWPRKPFLSRLRSSLQLHEYGDCGSKQCLPRHSQKCSLLMQRYKFLLILGNAECRDLIPADFWSLGLANGVVPVIYGVPKSNVERVAPPRSFIHVSDFQSVNGLAHYLKLVAADPDEYNKFLQWKNKGIIKITHPFSPEVVCRTVPHLFDGTPQYLSTLGESSWFNGCREKPGRDALEIFNRDRQYKAYNHWTFWPSI